MDCQVEQESHFWHLFDFNRDQKPSGAIRNICAMYGDGAIGERTAKDWIIRFKHVTFDLDDAPRSDRPVEMDEEQLGIFWMNMAARQAAN